MNGVGYFDSKAWLAALHMSFSESIRITLRDFADEITSDASFNSEELASVLQIIEQKMLWSVQVNIDRLENFYSENSAITENKHANLLQQIECRADIDSNYQERVDSVFNEIQASCGEFSLKKQRYLKYCLYDKYLNKEKALADNNGTSNDYLDTQVHKEKINSRAKQEKEFLKDFCTYVDLFGSMQTDLLTKLH